MQPIVEYVWREKYQHGNEADRAATLTRVVDAVTKNEGTGWQQRILDATLALRWCPAGRILAGAGTGKRVTLINCYVAPTIQDSMETEGRLTDEETGLVEAPIDEAGILDALKVAALTQQMGGGIGMDFSTLRPSGAVVQRTGSVASGPLPFMDMWNAMCATVMSSGARRGAMMATLRCDHPDIEAFVTAKRTAGRLTNFNVSVLVTEDFMKAVKNDEPWNLKFGVGRPDHPSQRAANVLYIYKTLPARELWDLILRNTYDHAEPGVIFIDRVNALNNLNYCETIAATNPCGEQPLPPNGACNLGAVNLAVHVLDPFTDGARIDFPALTETVRCGIRFLDNVHDITQHPTAAQAEEARLKRRVGLGITGLGNMLQQLRVRYGSPQAVELTETVLRHVATVAYDESANLAMERGPFPLWQVGKFNRAFYGRFPHSLQDKIREHGLRNGVLLTVAPTGTTSVFYDNVSSGIEPTYAWKATRKVLQPDGTRKEFPVYDWGILEYALGNHKTVEEILDGLYKLPDHMVTAEELTVDEHLNMQAAAQKWVDASISKTINVPVDLPYEEFQHVYERAYELGCKGVTTYRPSPTRGAVLTTAVSDIKEPNYKDTMTPTQIEAALEKERLYYEEKMKKNLAENLFSGPATTKRPRPEVLPGRTYKVRWPHAEKAYYITVNDGPDDRPFEVFVAGGDETQREWVGALARLTSALLRRGDSLEFVIEELEQIHATTGGAHMGERFRFVPSAPALVGKVLREHVASNGYTKSESVRFTTGTPEKLEGYAKQAALTGHWDTPLTSRPCPKCGGGPLISVGGCLTCAQCTYSKCD